MKFALTISLMMASVHAAEATKPKVMESLRAEYPGAVFLLSHTREKGQDEYWLAKMRGEGIENARLLTKEYYAHLRDQAKRELAAVPGVRYLPALKCRHLSSFTSISPGQNQRMRAICLDERTPAERALVAKWFQHIDLVVGGKAL